MSNSIFFMPTKIICEKNALKNHGAIMKELGSTALIVTGKTSSKNNGSLDDVLNTLKINNISYVIFDEVEENPSTETVKKLALLGKSNKVDFVIGIGGGSPIDAAKAGAVLIKNPDCSIDNLLTQGELTAIPLIAVPTTAGTGTETTPYSIVTDHSVKNKRAIPQKVFPLVSFVDATYLMHTPHHVTINTAIDALSHLIEGYLSTNSNIFSNCLAESGLKLFSHCMSALLQQDFPFEIREKLMVSSTIAGMVIAQSGTSLPHGMGYPLTYYKNVPHGMANGVLLGEYMELYKLNDKAKIDVILSILDMKSIEEFKGFIDKLINKDIIKISHDEILEYSKAMANNEAKLKNHPWKVKLDDIIRIYTNSLN